MEPSPLARACAWSFLLAGLASAPAGLLHPDDGVAGGVFSAAWVPVHVVQVFGFAGGGLGGLALGLGDRAGRGSVLAALLALGGGVLASGAAFLEATAVPRLVATLPEPISLLAVFGPGSPFPEMVPLFAVALLAYLVGNLAWSVAAWRDPRFPRGAVALLAVGALLQFAPLPGLGHGLTVALHAGAMAWLGAALLRSPAPALAVA